MVNVIKIAMEAFEKLIGERAFNGTLYGWKNEKLIEERAFNGIP